MGMQHPAWLTGGDVLDCENTMQGIPLIQSSRSGLAPECSIPRPRHSHNQPKVNTPDLQHQLHHTADHIDRPELLARSTRLTPLICLVD
eukprot:12411396-Karenia_brevis.AAC.1